MLCKPWADIPSAANEWKWLKQGLAALVAKLALVFIPPVLQRT